jgi:hypothetical protein
MIATNGVYEPAIITKKREKEREKKTYPEDDRNERRVRACYHHENHGPVEAIEHLV